MEKRIIVCVGGGFPKSPEAILSGLLPKKRDRNRYVRAEEWFAGIGWLLKRREDENRR